MPHDQPHVESSLRVGERFSYDGLLWEIEQLTPRSGADSGHNAGVYAHCLSQNQVGLFRWFSEAFVLGQVQKYQTELARG
jgi:hypothetical protein